MQALELRFGADSVGDERRAKSIQVLVDVIYILLTFGMPSRSGQTVSNSIQSDPEDIQPIQFNLNPTQFYCKRNVRKSKPTKNSIQSNRYATQSNPTRYNPIRFQANPIQFNPIHIQSHPIQPNPTPIKIPIESYPNHS